MIEIEHLNKKTIFGHIIEAEITEKSQICQNLS